MGEICGALNVFTNIKITLHQNHILVRGNVLSWLPYIWSSLLLSHWLASLGYSIYANFLFLYSLAASYVRTVRITPRPPFLCMYDLYINCFTRPPQYNSMWNAAGIDLGSWNRGLLWIRDPRSEESNSYREATSSIATSSIFVAFLFFTFPCKRCDRWSIESL